MEDLKDKKFNMLTAIKPLYLYEREWVWECHCECGNTTKVRISKLKNGLTKSCGCFKKRNLNHKDGKESINWKGYEGLSLTFYSSMKASAELRGTVFTLSPKYLWELFSEQNERCAYTGKVIKLPIHSRNFNSADNEERASLDRIDSERGYVKGNVQWVCKRVNYMKHTMKEDYFLSWVKSIYEYWFKE